MASIKYVKEGKINCRTIVEIKMPKNPLKILGNKKTIIAILLIMTFATSIIALPSSNAHTPAWQIPTYAFIHVSPDPVGVGQQVTVVFWIDKIFDSGTEFNNYKFHNYQVVITKPDGTTDKITVPIVNDPTSSTYSYYTPTQVGNYTFKFTFPGQKYTDYEYNPSSAYVNDTYLASSALTTLTVQQEQIPGAINYPLPTQYWARPIEGENWNWYSISSNWLSYPQIMANYQPDGIAPNSPHIMWTKPIEFGGVVGGTNTGTNGMTYYAGLSYETKFNPVIIMNGRLYYPLPKSDSGAGLGTSPVNDGFVCVDLLTGQQIFWQNTSMPSFGQLVDIENMDQHGVIPNGYLWQVSGTTWTALDPLDGNWLFTITNVPSGTSIYGPNGEMLIYTLNTAGKWLSMWNFTQLVSQNIAMATYRPVGTVINSTLRNPYTLNVTIPWLPSGASIVRVFTGDILLGMNGTLPSATSWAPWTMWAVNLNASRGTVGSMLWMQNYNAPAGNVTLALGSAGFPDAVDTVNRVFCMTVKETDQWYGYSLDTGSLLWGPTTYNWDSFQYYGSASGGIIPLVSLGYVAYGNLYVPGYGGEIVAFNDKTGNVAWVYNNTNSGLNTVYGHYPIQIGSIADGKIYAFTSEHSPNSPPYKGAEIRCINATDGTEMWTMLGWNTFTPYMTTMVEPIYVADGYISYLNVYDMQIYTVGKGPSTTTVEAPMAAITQGSSLVIRGTVMDISSGTKQDQQAADFPNGVPCVSDASQSAWMEYVYMQKPKPTNATGVPVSIDVIDANGNYRNIGTTTSDTSGTFSLQWKPDIPGKYTVIATFAGSESYWLSSAETAFAVDPAAATSAPTATPTQSMADAYFIPAIAGLFVLIIVVAVVLALLVLRKRP